MLKNFKVIFFLFFIATTGNFALARSKSFETWLVKQANERAQYHCVHFCSINRNGCEKLYQDKKNICKSKMYQVYLNNYEICHDNECQDKVCKIRCCDFINENLMLSSKTPDMLVQAFEENENSRKKDYIF